MHQKRQQFAPGSGILLIRAKPDHVTYPEDQGLLPATEAGCDRARDTARISCSSARHGGKLCSTSCQGCRGKGRTGRSTLMKIQTSGATAVPSNFCRWISACLCWSFAGAQPALLCIPQPCESPCTSTGPGTPVPAMAMSQKQEQPQMHLVSY